MKREFQKNILLILVLFLLYLSNCICYAFDLDMTVDDDIRKNYNSSKLILDTGIDVQEELPALPNIIKQNSNSQKPSQQATYNTKYIAPIYAQKGQFKIPNHTSFNVTNSVKISDWQTKGATVTFKLKENVIKKGYTVPKGTIFQGEVIEVHQPQITCNGGLVVVRIRNININGKKYPLNAYVTRANSKLIFLNNIKGDRTYLKTTWKKGNWGRTIFNKMLTLTINLGGDGSTLLLSPFPIAYGTICVGLNTLTSPICAFFNKGGHVSIPVGSDFRIKLLEEAYID